MIDVPSPSGSANTQDYREAFLGNAHRLLQLGYGRMNKATWKDADEPDITGELRVAMEKVIDAPDAADWLHPFSVEDEYHVNDGKRRGKSRKKVDIRISSSQPRPRNHLSFESKRLSEKNPVRTYLGNEGLGCFLSGAYAAEDDDGGMIGYVQSGKPGEWSESLAKDLASTEYAVCVGGELQKHEFKEGPEYIFVSRHRRSSVGRDIRVFHTLLVFQ